MDRTLCSESRCACEDRTKFRLLTGTAHRSPRRPTSATIWRNVAPCPLPELTAVKKCPFCAEEIQDEARVCKHCGRDLVQGALQSARFETRTPLGTARDIVQLVAPRSEPAPSRGLRRSSSGSCFWAGAPRRSTLDHLGLRRRKGRAVLLPQRRHQRHPRDRGDSSRWPNVRL